MTGSVASIPYRFKCPHCGELQDVPFWKVAFDPHFILLLAKPVEGVDRVLMKCSACGRREFQKYLGKVDASKGRSFVKAPTLPM